MPLKFDPAPVRQVERIDFDPDLSVMLGIPIHAHLPMMTVRSIIDTTRRLTQMGIKHEVLMHACNVVTLARDGVMMRFLDSDHQKLFWIDSDMAWDEQAFFTMLALSQKVDVVTAAYPAKTEKDGTFFVNCDINGKVGPYGLREIDGTGLGFTIVDRVVCQGLADRAPKVFDQLANREMAEVFRIDTSIVDGVRTRRTEDMAFFADIQDLGYTVWCKPDVVLGHIGEKMWRASLQQAFDEGTITAPPKPRKAA